MKKSITSNHIAQERINMQEDLITFKTAILAKEKGFDWRVQDYFNKDGVHLGAGGWVDCNSSNTLYSKPTQSLLQKWLMDTYNLYVIPLPTGIILWSYKIIALDGLIEQPPYDGVSMHDYSKHKKAFEAGLIEALKLIKP